MYISLKESLKLIDEIILIVRPDFSSKLRRISYTCLLVSSILELPEEMKKQVLFFILQNNIYDIHTSQITSFVNYLKKNAYLKNNNKNEVLLTLQEFFPPPKSIWADKLTNIDFHSIYWISVTSLLLPLPKELTSVKELIASHSIHNLKIFNTLSIKLYSSEIAEKISNQIYNREDIAENNKLLNKSISLYDLKEISIIVIEIIKIYSPFTAKHSLTVGQISRLLSLKIKETSTHADEIEIAGLLHDIGKIYIPVYILEKQGSLNTEELNSLQSHCIKTREILEQFPKLGDIIIWASNHHEKLDGSGYPLQLTAKSLDLPSRIITVADIFSALTENRPYRFPLSFENALKIMEKDVIDGKLDIYVFNALKTHIYTSGNFIK